MKRKIDIFDFQVMVSLLIFLIYVVAIGFIIIP